MLTVLYIYPGLCTYREGLIGHPTSYTIDVSFTGNNFFFLQIGVIKCVGLKLLRDNRYIFSNFLISEC
jgi:hypothetical protein